MDDTVGFILIMLIAFALGGYTGNVTHSSNSLIKECEATLPRDQQCVLVAVPEEQTDD
ncbi:hypothetical protein OAA60_00775 [Porticoccaceae bacterium]|nr:hypothetical protein [Porticoccaceae bacterium]